MVARAAAAGLGALMQTTLPQASRRVALPLLPAASANPNALWQAFWRPYWAWSDAPPPELAAPDAPLPAEIGLAGQAVVGGLDRIRRNLWLSHAAVYIARGIWLGLLVAAGLMLLDLLGGPVFNPRLAGGIGIVLVLGGVALASRSKPGRQRTARMLDSSFRLHERLATALDDLGVGVPQPGTRAPLIYLQMADAANAVAMLRADHRLRPALPVREVAMIVICALLLTVLTFARGLGGGLPALETARVPAFTPAIERPEAPEPTAAEVAAAAAPPSVQEVLEASDRSGRARRDLQQLASALSDHPATSQAAADISAGDYAAAGDQLRQAAAQAGNLSPEGRQALAQDLQQAANEMDPGTNGLQEATQSAADSLQQDPAAASDGIRDLADAVEKTGEDVQSQSDLASQMRTARQAQTSQGTMSQTGGDSRGDPNEANAGEQGSNGAQGSAQSSGSLDPGQGADASGNQPGESSGEQQGGGEQGGESGGQSGAAERGAGEGGAGEAPGAAGDGGIGENSGGGEGAAGGETGAGAEGSGDSEVGRPGGGAGTGRTSDAQ
ncbi:MAG: hypothetical protein QM692_13335, partial [Thermomicrobiales bacterium]